MPQKPAHFTLTVGNSQEDSILLFMHCRPYTGYWAFLTKHKGNAVRGHDNLCVRLSVCPRLKFYQRLNLRSSFKKILYGSSQNDIEIKLISRNMPSDRRTLFQRNKELLLLLLLLLYLLYIEL